ncbi:MAG: hypothetical protein AMR96_04240 [Candidatus Adiutrix intracellularis]|nr:MAG: hypothetical protein AMR96_04240 [Candidatus Adiutrix intracellularis]
MTCRVVTKTTRIIVIFFQSFKFGYHFEAVHIGYYDVHKDKIKWVLLNFFQAVKSIYNQNNFIALRFKYGLDYFTVEDFVIHNHNLARSLTLLDGLGFSPYYNSAFII